MAGLAVAAITGLAPVVAGSATASAGPAQATTANWLGFHDNPAHTDYNPHETTLGTGNVSGLSQQWLASTAGPASGDAPTIAGGRAFTGGQQLQAWNASTGALDWTAPTQYVSSATYGGGRVFRAVTTPARSWPTVSSTTR
jgi:hypothetical protein